jgi:hypothetical protein
MILEQMQHVLRAQAAIIAPARRGGVLDVALAGADRMRPFISGREVGESAAEPVEGAFDVTSEYAGVIVCRCLVPPAGSSPWRGGVSGR